MRKLLLLVAALAFVGCSKDDDNNQQIILPPSTNSMKATIDGTQYVFNHFTVETETNSGPDGSYVDLHVIASIDGDDSKRIEFNCEQDVPGTDSIYWFYSFFGTDFDYDYEETDIAFTANLTLNSNRRLVGTFAGTLDSFDNDQQITVTNGSFDITY